ncbi:MAG: helix-turn-helix domain-containing protein, partial [Acidimicrobiales bacterium]
MEQSRLARLRRMNGYTQERLAETLEVDVSSIRRWEKGQVIPRATVRSRLAAELHLSLEALDVVLAGSDTDETDETDGPGADGRAGRLSSGSSTVMVGVEDVDRRQFLIGAGALLGLSALPAAMSGAGPKAYRGELVDHLGREWHSLVAADNHFGPAHAIHGVRANLKMVSGVLVEAKATDQQKTLRLGAQYAESAAWLCEDLGDVAGATSWMQTAALWAQRGAQRDLSTWTMVGRARQAVLRRDAVSGLALADKAIDTTPPTLPAMQAAALCYKAEALALRGDERLCHSTLDRAERLAASVEIDPGA